MRVSAREPELGSADLPNGIIWPPLVRVSFLFILLYLGLSACFWVFEFADKVTAFIARPYLAFWRPWVQWVGVHVFGWPAAIAPSFVRDTRYLYALLTCLLLFSAVGAVVWFVAAGKRTNYRLLNGWLRVFIRYVLAYLMLHYGMDKVFFLQFPAPSLARLTEPFGEYSPSSLMWAFIGSSVAYTIFGGLAEIIGAVLLLFRRTTTLGALITFAVMLNVAVMDFSYDVSVKIFSLHLLLMAGFLALPDGRRLIQFFILNRSVEATPEILLVRGERQRKLAVVFKIALILYLIVPLTIRDWRSYHGAGATHPPLYGLYAVDQFLVNGKIRDPLLTDTERWRFVIVELPNMLTVKRMDETLENYPATYDSALQRLVVAGQSEPAKQDSLVLSRRSENEPGGGAFVLKGRLNGSEIEASLRRVDRSSFELIGRGFHWISESSYAR